MRNLPFRSNGLNADETKPVFGKKAWTRNSCADNTHLNTMSSLLTVVGRLLWIGATVALPLLAQGQNALSPQGAEFLLSGALPGDQAAASLSLGTAGGCVVWQDNRTNWGLAARMLDISGHPLGEPFRVNAAVLGNIEKPQVAMLNGGGAAFVWQGGRAGFENTYARFMGADGNFVSSDVLVSQPPLSTNRSSTVSWKIVRNNRVTVRKFRLVQSVEHRRDFNGGAVVAVLNNGNVAVASASYVRYCTNEPVQSGQIKFYGTQGVTNSVVTANARVQDRMQDVYLQLFTPTGMPLGGEAVVHQFTAYNQRNPALAALPNGNFVTVWVSENQGLTDNAVAGGSSRVDVYARLFNASGLALTDDLLVNDAALTDNGSPAVAALAGGGFRVVWAQRSDVASEGWDIVTRSFDPLGVANSVTRRVNTETYGDQYAPKIAASLAGEIIVWTSLGQDGSREGVYGQWMSSGALVGGEFRVNTTTVGSQYQPAVAVSPGNRILVGWASVARESNPPYRSLGSGFDIFGQLY